MDKNSEHKERALRKLRLELENDIELAVKLSQLCEIWELLRLGFLLHICRLQTHLEERRSSMTHGETLSMQLIEDATKYSISIVASNGLWQSGLNDSKKDGLLNNELVNDVLEICQHINAKYEYESLIPIADVTVSGERDQECAIDLSSAMESPERARMISYGYRLENVTFISKNRTLDAEQHLNKFKTDFADIGDLFQLDTGLTIEEYCSGLTSLIRLVQGKIQLAEGKCATLSNGNIDIQHARSFYALARAFIVESEELLGAVGEKFLAYMQRTRFQPQEVSISELRFHYLSRKPYFFGEGFAVIFPSLVLDSIFTNTHFSLLEKLEAKPSYVERRSKWFVDKICATASPFGFIEIARDLYLREGKKNYGDIDLILQHQTTGNYLLVEAKNHALPLDVYFRSHTHTEVHLERTKDWERKVAGRLAYLARHSSEIGITNPYRYIIVTLHPEILSHVSEIMVLSIDEFELWIRAGCEPEKFIDFYTQQYHPEKSNLSDDDVLQLQRDGFALMRPKR